MITAQDILDNDHRLKVTVCPHGTSANIEAGIWYGQHTCVTEGFSPDDELPPNPGEAVIKHQLRVEHYSVLNFGFIVLHCQGFPHSTMAQITRHQDSKFLVQSGRYTGKRFVDVATSNIPIEDVFYFRPVGIYQDRQGKRYNHTQRNLDSQKGAALIGCGRYAHLVLAEGYSEEHARDVIPYNFRQNFAIAGTVEALFHWLDQRSKRDSQLEIQALSILALQRLKETAPNLGQWYEDNRFGKARLAP